MLSSRHCSWTYFPWMVRLRSKNQNRFSFSTNNRRKYQRSEKNKTHSSSVFPKEQTNILHHVRVMNPPICVLREMRESEREAHVAWNAVSWVYIKWHQRLLNIIRSALFTGAYNCLQILTMLFKVRLVYIVSPMYIFLKKNTARAQYCTKSWLKCNTNLCSKIHTVYSPDCCNDDGGERGSIFPIQHVRSSTTTSTHGTDSMIIIKFRHLSIPSNSLKSSLRTSISFYRM